MMWLAFLPAAVLGGDVGAQTVPPSQIKIAAADKPVCRVLTPTGNIMGTRVCHTRAQWAAADSVYERQRDKGGQSNTIDRSQGGQVGPGGHTNSLGF